MHTEGQRAGQSLVRGLVDVTDRETSRVGHSVEGRLRDERGRFVAAGEHAGESLVRGILRSIGAHAGSIASSIGGGLSGVGKVAGGGITMLVSMPSLIAGAIGALAPLVPLVSSAAVALGSLIPAAISSAVVALGTLKVAFTGVGEALKNAGDPAKFAEALKKLAPSAQEAVKAMVGLKPALTGVRMEVQQRFFAGFAGDIKALGSSYLPMLRTQLGGVADGLNATLRGLTGWLRVPDTLNSITTSLSNMGKGIANASGALVALMSGFNDLVEVGSKFLPGLGAGFTGLANRFSAFMARVAGSGQLEQWISTGLEALSKLGALFKDLGSIVVSLVQAMGAASGSALGPIGELVHSLAGFAKSAEGMQAFTAIFQVLGQLASVFGTAISLLLPVVGKLVTALAPLIGSVLNLVTSLLPPLIPVFNAIVDAITPLVAALAPVIDIIAGQLVTVIQVLAPILAAVAQVISDVLVQALTALMPVFEQLLPVVVQLATAYLPPLIPIVGLVGQIFAALMPVLVPLIKLLADILTPVIKILTPIIESMTPILTVLADVIVLVITPIAELVGWLLRLLDSADTWKAVGGFFVDLWHTIGSGFDTIVGWVKALPGRILDGIKALPHLLWTTFLNAITGVTHLIFRGIGWWIGELLVLPGQVWNILTSMWNGVVAILKGLWHWVANSFATARTNATNVVADMWHTAKKNFSDGVAAVIGFITSLPHRAGVELGKLVSKVKGLAGDAKTWLVHAGENVIHGLIQGFKNVKDHAVGFIKSLGSDIVHGFKSAVGISSPSRVFAAHGADIVAGLVQGIDRNSQHAVVAASRMLSGVTGAGTVGVGGRGGAYAMGGAGGGVEYVPIQVNLGGAQMAIIHAQLVPVAQRYKTRTGTTGLS